MGIFNKINERSGLITGVIVVALILFMLGGDLLGPTSFFSGNKNQVGEIADQNISYEEYSAIFEQMRNDYSQRTGRNPSDYELTDLHKQAWSNLIFKYAYQEQMDKLGLTVTEEELEEMVTGNNLYEGILSTQIFQDSVGQFDRKKYDEWRKNLAQNPQAQAYFENYKQEQMRPDRLRSKYLNLFKNATYVTKAEARREYVNQNTKAEVKYLWVPFTSLADSNFKVTDEEIAEYLAKNEKKYQKGKRASIEYVVFSINPSPSDSVQAITELQELKKEFAETTDDSLFVSSNSDNPVAPSIYRLSELPELLKGKTDSLNAGQVYGPFTESGKSKLFKVIEVIQDPQDTMYYASTKHILFMTRDKAESEKDSIKRKAQQVLAQLKNGEISFDDAVLQYSEDPGSKTKGGEYKWFPKGQMVKPFEQGVFNAKSEGLVNTLVETEYGYHILSVTDLKSNKKFRIASIEKDIIPAEGRERAYQQALKFVEAAKDSVSFKAQATQDSIEIQKVKTLTPEQANVNTLSNPRELIRWIFTEGESDEVSSVFSINDQYVVALVHYVRKEGTAEVDEVRDEIRPIVMGRKKADQIIEKLNSLPGDMTKKGEGYGAGANTGTAKDVTIATGSMQGIGYEPEIVGTVFGLVAGKRTVPLKGDNGVAILELVKLTEATEVADYTTQKNTLKQSRSNFIQVDIDEAIKENADIEDNRVKFF